MYIDGRGERPAANPSLNFSLGEAYVRPLPALLLALWPGTLIGQVPDPPDPGPEPATVLLDTLSTADPREDTGEGMRPYHEVIPEDAESDEGVFTVHKVDDDFLFEIPTGILPREFLLQTRITKAPTGTAYGGARESIATVRWERRGERLLLRLVGHENVAPDTLPIFEAVRTSNFEPILFAFDVETMPPDSSAVVIDVTDFFAADTPVIGLRPSRRESFGVRSFVRDRSFIESIRSFPGNVEVRRTVTFGAGDTPAQDVGGALSFELGHSLLILPQEPMAPRERDERVGYFSVRQNDFGSREQRVAEREFIRRWRLEPSDPAAYLRSELVEPVRPIVFHIDSATPAEWRPYLKAGVEDWAEAFEEAGFKDAIVARDAPTPEEDPEYDAADARYSVIRYLASEVENAMGPSFFDPRSGEILGSHIQWHHNVLNLVRNWYFVQTAAANPEARATDFDPEVMGALLRYVTAHEVGHALGLPHNMKGHSAVPVDSLRTRWVCDNGTSTSIMDYARFNYVAQPGDDTCFIPRVGQYDRWAIEWGYRWFPETMKPDDIRTILREWITERGEDPRYRFGDPSASDPGATSEALGNDPVRASELGVANLKRILPNLLEWTYDPGESYEQLRELYGEVLEQWQRYVRHVTLAVGGVEWTRRAQGQSGRPYSPVRRDRQRAAMGYLDRHVFRTPEWMIDPEILYRIEDSGIQDRIRRLQVDALGGLLSVNRMKRLAEQTALSRAEAYSLREMLADLRRAVWWELETGAPVGPFRRNLQRGYLEEVEELLRNEDALATDIAPLLRGELSAIREAAEAVATEPSDPLSGLHVEDVIARIGEILDPVE